MSQSLLLQVLAQLSEVDGRLGVLQGQCNEIIREQQRAADGRKLIYDKINQIDVMRAAIARLSPLVDDHERKSNEAAGAMSVMRAEIARLSPLVDDHERKSNEAAGAISLGRVVVMMGSGMFGAALTLAIKWLLEGRPAPHP